MERSFRLTRPLSLPHTLGALQQGPHDPSMRVEAHRLWWAMRTPSGAAATLFLEEQGMLVSARAWGDGAEEVMGSVPELIGEHQDDDRFACDNAVVWDLHRKMSGFRVPRTGNVAEMLLPLILSQRVTGREAKASYRRIVAAMGEPAPGPANLRLQPTTKHLAAQPYWWFHRFGVERRRAETIRTAAKHAMRLQEVAQMRMSRNDAQKRLLAVPGIGKWTTGEIMFFALGDPDAVTVGDFHFPDQVAWALAGEARGDDARMLELLEPFRGQRGRVLRLIVRGHPSPPKFGPRYNPIPISAL